MDVAGIGEDDTVVEIGPGLGRLTRLIAERVKRVVAIEIDLRLVNRLRDELEGLPNVEIVHLDALKYPYESLGSFKVVSNIPYYITTPLIFRLLGLENLVSMTITIQKEVAERIVAVPGSRSYGVLSIMVQYRARPEIKFFIPKGAFRPIPNVNSAVIHIETLSGQKKAKDEQLFKRIVRTAFSKRRKTILNALKSLKIPEIKSILEVCGIDPSRRPESLSIEEYIRISDKVTDKIITAAGRVMPAQQ